MRSLAAALAIVSLSAGAALASGSIECVSADGEASLSLVTGSLPVLAVVGASIEARGERWTLGGEGANAIAVGQAFRNDGEMRIDFTDPNVEAVVAEIRLYSASEGTDMATAGTMRIAGSGAWALSCTGP